MAIRRRLDEKGTIVPLFVPRRLGLSRSGRASTLGHDQYRLDAAVHAAPVDG